MGVADCTGGAEATAGTVDAGDDTLPTSDKALPQNPALLISKRPFNPAQE
ncbi:hypothetical protein GCM10010409_06360 [Mycolicibacterium diernhoferi]